MTDPNIPGIPKIPIIEPSLKQIRSKGKASKENKILSDFASKFNPKDNDIPESNAVVSEILFGRTPEGEMTELSKGELIERLTACQLKIEKLQTENADIKKTRDKPRILCAAIWYLDLPLAKVFDDNVLPVNCDRGIVFCGHRHPQCMYSMCSMTGKRSVTPEVGQYIQGFITSDNRFVGRQEAATIAWDAGQLDSPRTILYSEDLY